MLHFIAVWSSQIDSFSQIVSLMLPKALLLQRVWSNTSLYWTEKSEFLFQDNKFECWVYIDGHSSCICAPPASGFIRTKQTWRFLKQFEVFIEPCGQYIHCVHKKCQRELIQVCRTRSTPVYMNPYSDGLVLHRLGCTSTCYNVHVLDQCFIGQCICLFPYFFFV